MYKWIRAWGFLLGSYPYYVNEQIQRAKDTNAPETAIYEKSAPGGIRTGEWATKEDCRPATQQQLEEIVANHGW